MRKYLFKTQISLYNFTHLHSSREMNENKNAEVENMQESAHFLLSSSIIITISQEANKNMKKDEINVLNSSQECS